MAKSFVLLIFDTWIRHPERVAMNTVATKKKNVTLSMKSRAVAKPESVETSHGRPAIRGIRTHAADTWLKLIGVALTWR